jgi:hypothetical protein
MNPNRKNVKAQRKSWENDFMVSRYFCGLALLRLGLL